MLHFVLLPLTLVKSNLAPIYIISLHHHHHTTTTTNDIYNNKTYIRYTYKHGRMHTTFLLLPLPSSPSLDPCYVL
jgi:hypothetical protein